MSSHHVVRDTQEPALIIAEINDDLIELVQQLLEWSPVVLVLKDALPKVLALGIKVDAILGDFDLNDIVLEDLQYQQPLEIINHVSDGNSLIQYGAEWLKNKGHKAINIITNAKDVELITKELVALHEINSELTLVFFTVGFKVFCLPNNYIKWYPKGTQLRVIPYGNVEGFNTIGFANNVDASFNVNTMSKLNLEVLNDGVIKIQHQVGKLVLIEDFLING